MKWALTLTRKVEEIVVDLEEGFLETEVTGDSSVQMGVQHIGQTCRGVWVGRRVNILDSVALGLLVIAMKRTSEGMRRQMWSLAVLLHL